MSLIKTRVKSVKPGRTRKAHVAPGQLELDLDGILRAVEKSDDAAGLVRAMIAISQQDKKQWRGMVAVPPGGLADLVIGEFRQKTNIPLEIPFFTLLSVISGFLLQRGISLKTSNLGEIKPDIWTVILASSGVGKTYTQNRLTNGLNIDEIEFPGTGIVSAAAFVQALEKMPKGLWIRDEFGMFLQAIEKGDGPLGEMKDYLLRLYDNAKIERATVKATVSVAEPALTILGMTVLETFGDHVSPESMLDGFAQRFGYVVAQSDPDRYWRDYGVWMVDNSRWAAEWAKITSQLHPHYTVSDDVFLPAFSAAFQSLFNDVVPESFYRRLLWKAAKYALIYHVLRGDADQALKAEDFGWAARVISLHVQDAAWLIGEHNLSGLEKILLSSEKVLARVKEKEGRGANARDLVRGVSAIKTTQQATQILKMLIDK